MTNLYVWRGSWPGNGLARKRSGRCQNFQKVYSSGRLWAFWAKHCSAVQSLSLYVFSTITGYLVVELAIIFPFYPGGHDVCAVNYSSHKSKKEPEPSRMLITTLGVCIFDSESCFGASGFCGQSQGSAFFLPFPLASHRTIQRLEHRFRHSLKFQKAKMCATQVCHWRQTSEQVRCSWSRSIFSGSKVSTDLVTAWWFRHAVYQGPSDE